MKKKIIYISGAETFAVADVQTAFDEVRTALNLDTDTILFGVPIDNMDTKTESVADIKTEPEPESVAVEEVVDVVEPIAPIITESVVDAGQDEQEPETESDSHVVPILSVLGAKTTVAPAQEIETPDLTESVQPIEDMLQDDAPTAATEQTLEELLEKMTPLREDVHIDQVDEAPVDETPVVDTEDDATLENLASEFAKVQETMPVPKKSAERGKISKLKNILPFKKIKRDDSGLMGDLFGWAGIAANDDEFSMPGFFAGVAGKK